MRSIAAAGVVLLLLATPGCGGRGGAELYGSVHDYSDPGLKLLRDELRTLPFRHVEWEYKFTEKEISRITLGMENLYLETPDHRVIAVDRFSGVTRWIYQVDTDTPLDWPPIEAYQVPDEIRREETDLRAANRKIDDIIKEKGPGKESQEAQKKRDQIRERLAQARNGDNVYFISRGVLYCLVRTTGNLLWTRRLTIEFAPSAQPFAIRSHIFVPGADLSRVWALDVEKRGRAITFYRTSIGTHDKNITNRPLYEDPALFFVSHDGAVYSYNLQGGQNWAYQTEDELRTDPVIFKYVEMAPDPKGVMRPKETKILFVGGFDHAFYAIEAAGGGLMWKYETAGPIKTPAVAKGSTVYFKTEGGALFALEINPQHIDPKTGKSIGPKRNGNLRWKLPLGERFLTRGKDHVYVLGPNQEVYRLNENTGEVIGRYPLRLLQHVVTNPLDDILYVAHPSGYVWALREAKD